MPSTQLPGPVDDAVGRLVLVHLDVRSFEPPPVVGDDLGVEIAGGVDQRLTAPVLGTMPPVAITPQVLRSEPLDQVEHVGMQHLVDVLVARVATVAPVEQRVVRAEHEPGSLAGRRVLGEHVAARSVVQHRSIGARRVPPAQSVVVFGDEDRVPHAGDAREPGPGIRIEASRTTATARSHRSVRRGPSGRDDGRAPRPSGSGAGSHRAPDRRGGCGTSRRTARSATTPAPSPGWRGRTCRSDAAPTTPACSREPILAGSQRCTGS